MTRQGQWARAHEEAGMCRSCSEPIARGALCARHLAAVRASQAKYRERMRRRRALIDALRAP